MDRKWLFPLSNVSQEGSKTPVLGGQNDPLFGQKVAIFPIKRVPGGVQKPGFWSLARARARGDSPLVSMGFCSVIEDSLLDRFCTTSILYSFFLFFSKNGSFLVQKVVKKGSIPRYWGHAHSGGLGYHLKEEVCRPLFRP